MINKVMVTVYCLIYNHEKYIQDVLESLISQKNRFSIKGSL